MHNRRIRYQWALEHRNWAEEQWRFVCFSDESRFEFTGECSRDNTLGGFITALKKKGFFGQENQKKKESCGLMANSRSDAQRQCVVDVHKPPEDFNFPEISVPMIPQWQLPYNASSPLHRSMSSTDSLLQNSPPYIPRSIGATLEASPPCRSSLPPPIEQLSESCSALPLHGDLQSSCPFLSPSPVSPTPGVRVVYRYLPLMSPLPARIRMVPPRLPPPGQRPSPIRSPLQSRMSTLTPRQVPSSVSSPMPILLSQSPMPSLMSPSGCISPRPPFLSSFGSVSTLPPGLSSSHNVSSASGQAPISRDSSPPHSSLPSHENFPRTPGMTVLIASPARAQSPLPLDSPPLPPAPQVPIIALSRPHCYQIMNSPSTNNHSTLRIEIDPTTSNALPESFLYHYFAQYPGFRGMELNPTKTYANVYYADLAQMKFVERCSERITVLGSQTLRESQTGYHEQISNTSTPCFYCCLPLLWPCCKK
ncbi:hypothetical protein evm_013850 [Chilo suppressalis]|nr:hypothetical protein evm_013850 [Chilo suppressalis]